MQRRAELETGDLLFTLKDITYTPESPRMNEPFTVSGKVELLKIPFVMPIWVLAKVTYPEEWWEEIIPIWGSPTVGESQTALGGDFEIKFPRGFDREGEFLLDVEVHAGPTFTLDSITLPPFPPMASQAMTFIVGGEVPPEEVGFRNFSILSYSKNGGTPVMPPSILELEVGDRCRVNVGFDHRNSAVTAKFHAAIGNLHHGPPEWFDEVLDAEKTFSVPSSVDWEPWEGYIDIIVTSAISPGNYSLYVKIMGITGGDIFTPHYENVITIVGPPPAADIKDFDFTVTKGTYDIGDTVPFTAPYDYKGIAQSGQLTISLGTGVYPSFFTKHTYSPIPVTFEEATDWEHRGLQGNITLPDVLEPGQTYSIRAKLETLEAPTQETDTDWSAFDITAAPEMETLEVRIDPPGAGYVTTSPAPSGGVQHNWKFPHGTTVYVTAHPNSGYRFKSWSGEMTDTTAITAPVYLMTEHRLITAHFEQEIELETLEVRIDPVGAGEVTTEPAPSGGIKHNWLFPYGTTVYVTAHPNPGYVFDSWSGEMTDTPAITAPVYPMTEHRRITAHFREEEVPPEEYEGTISKKQLEYNETRRSIPVSSVPLDKRGLVHIWGRNDMNSNQKMGIWWQVKDPDGIVVREYARWEAFWTGPGNAQEFIGGRFDLDKPGTYTIDVELFMNPDDQVCVDDYHGTLCTVAEAPPPTAISFDVMIWGTGGFGHYDKWWCDYWDPGVNDFVGDKEWHYPYQDIRFSNVEPGGYLAVFLLEDSRVSSQFSSPTFQAVDGGRYQYDLDLNRVSKLG